MAGGDLLRRVGILLGVDVSDTKDGEEAMLRLTAAVSGVGTTAVPATSRTAALAKETEHLGVAAGTAAKQTAEATKQLAGLGKAEAAAEGIRKISAAMKEIGLSTEHLDKANMHMSDLVGGIGKLDAEGIKLTSNLGDAMGSLSGKVGTANVALQTLLTSYNLTTQAATLGAAAAGALNAELSRLGEQEPKLAGVTTTLQGLVTQWMSLVNPRVEQGKAGAGMFDFLTGAKEKLDTAIAGVFGLGDQYGKTAQQIANENHIIAETNEILGTSYTDAAEAQKALAEARTKGQAAAKEELNTMAALSAAAQSMGEVDAYVAEVKSDALEAESEAYAQSMRDKAQADYDAMLASQDAAAATDEAADSIEAEGEVAEEATRSKEDLADAEHAVARGADDAASSAFDSAGAFGQWGEESGGGAPGFGGPREDPRAAALDLFTAAGGQIDLSGGGGGESMDFGRSGGAGGSRPSIIHGSGVVRGGGNGQIGVQTPGRGPGHRGSGLGQEWRPGLTMGMGANWIPKIDSRGSQLLPGAGQFAGGGGRNSWENTDPNGGTEVGGGGDGGLGQESGLSQALAATAGLGLTSGAYTEGGFGGLSFMLASVLEQLAWGNPK